MLSLGANAAAITLAIVAIWMAISSTRESRTNHERTLTTLAAVSERAAVTERTVGEHFDKLMSTLLSMAHSIAIAPEVRAAEINRLGEEQQARIQSDIIKVLSEAMKWGDGDKVEALVRAVEAITPSRGLNSGPLRHRPNLERSTTIHEP
jgi:L-lactate permease